MNSLPIITVIIPTYNRSEFIEDALQSIKLQDYPYVQVILSDNNSSFFHKQKLNEILTNHSDVVYINHQNSYSLSEHWSIAIDKYALGEIILILPDDDKIVDKSYFTKAVNLFNNSASLGIVFANLHCVNRFGNIVNEVSFDLPTVISNDFMLCNYKATYQGKNGFGIPHLTSLFRKSAYYEVSGLDYSCLSPDTYLWLNILLKYDCGFIKDKVAAYMIHDDNISKSPPVAWVINDANMISHLKQKYKNYNKFKSKLFLEQIKTHKRDLRRIEFFFMSLAYSGLRTKFDIEYLTKISFKSWGNFLWLKFLEKLNILKYFI